MTQSDKELLLKDLCARLPYGVNADITLNKEDECLNSYPIVGIVGDKIVFETDIVSCSTDIEAVKPYLRLMSSMTEDESNKYTHLTFVERIDWLNSHHFDYRGLIEKGLALEAPEGMYKSE